MILITKVCMCVCIKIHNRAIQPCDLLILRYCMELTRGLLFVNVYFLLDMRVHPTTTPLYTTTLSAGSHSLDVSYNALPGE